MKKILALVALSLGAILVPLAADFEDAKTAVKNMGIGWNAGNRLDTNSGDANNMWIEVWTERTPRDYETAWGQPQITRDLIHMFKEAGFNAIRVPVTWYPHMGNFNVNVSTNASNQKVGTWDIMGWSGYEVDPVWMARVKEVVDYVIDEDMYCILDVHHDTGEATTAWLRADINQYNFRHELFENLWKQIATTFKDYDQHLLFEGYNEMLDVYNSWCYASFSAPNQYNATVAQSAYNGVNSFAQSFVDAVRATGGNNTQRNLIVNTYAASSGNDTWNQHLADPLREMKIPNDANQDHLAFEVHYYPSPTTLADCSTVTESLFTALNEYLAPKGLPIIVGEWGIFTNSNHPQYQEIFCAFAEQFVRRAKEENVATLLWMTAADGNDCVVPQWTNPNLKDAIVKGYYGDAGIQSIDGISTDTKPQDIYTLEGIKVDRPTKPGIYISAGKKIFLK